MRFRSTALLEEYSSKGHLKECQIQIGPVHAHESVNEKAADENMSVAASLHAMLQDDVDDKGVTTPLAKRQKMMSPSGSAGVSAVVENPILNKVQAIRIENRGYMSLLSNANYRSTLTNSVLSGQESKLTVQANLAKTAGNSDASIAISAEKKIWANVAKLIKAHEEFGKCRRNSHAKLEALANIYLEAVEIADLHKLIPNVIEEVCSKFLLQKAVRDRDTKKAVQLCLLSRACNRVSDDDAAAKLSNDLIGLSLRTHAEVGPNKKQPSDQDVAEYMDMLLTAFGTVEVRDVSVEARVALTDIACFVKNEPRSGETNIDRIIKRFQSAELDEQPIYKEFKACDSYKAILDCAVKANANQRRNTEVAETRKEAVHLLAELDKSHSDIQICACSFLITHGPNLATIADAAAKCQAADSKDLNKDGKEFHGKVVDIVKEVQKNSLVQWSRAAHCLILSIVKGTVSAEAQQLAYAKLLEQTTQYGEGMEVLKTGRLREISEGTKPMLNAEDSASWTSDVHKLLQALIGVNVLLVGKPAFSHDIKAYVSAIFEMLKGDQRSVLVKAFIKLSERVSRLSFWEKRPGLNYAALSQATSKEFKTLTGLMSKSISGAVLELVDDIGNEFEAQLPDKQVPLTQVDPEYKDDNVFLPRAIDLENDVVKNIVAGAVPPDLLNRDDVSVEKALRALLIIGKQERPLRLMEMRWALAEARVKALALLPVASSTAEVNGEGVTVADLGTFAAALVANVIKPSEKICRSFTTAKAKYLINTDVDENKVHEDGLKWIGAKLLAPALKRLVNILHCLVQKSGAFVPAGWEMWVVNRCSKEICENMIVDGFIKHVQPINTAVTEITSNLDACVKFFQNISELLIDAQLATDIAAILKRAQKVMVYAAATTGLTFVLRKWSAASQQTKSGQYNAFPDFLRSR